MGYITLFEVSNGSLGISEDSLSIGNALGDISETFSINSSLENSSNNKFEFSGIGSLLSL